MYIGKMKKNEVAILENHRGNKNRTEGKFVNIHLLLRYDF